MSELINACLIRNNALFSTEIDQDLVMMDVDQGYYFSLNGTAKTIWELLDSPKRYLEIIQVLVEKYRMTAEQALADVEPFVLEMMSHQLIQQVAFDDACP
jgi:hypothetical protein